MRLAADARVAQPMVVFAALVSTLAPSMAGPGSAGHRVLITESGDYRVEYRAEPHPIPLNEPFALQVTVRGRFRRLPEHYVELEVDAGMPAHDHGMFTAPQVTVVAPGRFRVGGMLFHMPGQWRMRFVVRRGLMGDIAETDVEVP